MTGAQTSRHHAWTPPQRPEWVERINAEGMLLNIAAIVPLDEASLIAAAMADTGLKDFGDDDWREPFSILLRSLEDEAELTLMGRIMTRSDLLMFLEARLRVEDCYRRHPEIEEQRIDRPLWVFGQGRSGTSMLQTLLGLDPDNRTTKIWEAMFPAPIDPGQPDHRREIAEGRITQWNRVTPEIQAMHEFAADAQTETIHFEAMSFRTPAWLNLLGLTPSYNAWMAGQDYEMSFGYALRVFKLLQWQNPGRRWVFKSPDSLSRLPELLRVFPDARLIWAHRDPVKSMSSAVNLIGTLTWIRSNRKHAPGTFDQITDPECVAAALSQPIDLIESGGVPRDQLCNIQYADLISDPLTAVSQIYAHFDLPFTDRARSAIEAYLVAHPREARPAHRYATGSEAEVSAERASLRRYQAYFAVPDEG